MDNNSASNMDERNDDENKQIEVKEEEATTVVTPPSPSHLNWHGAPRLDPVRSQVCRAFRHSVRSGQWKRPTNAQCPGFLQCNLVILPKQQYAFDFLLFCQRNPQACPLLEVCDVGSPHPVGLAMDADVRTDCPMYSIYRNGQLEQDVADITDWWSNDMAAFLIGCSFTCDGALLDAGIPLRSAEHGRNIPMYKTNVSCRPAGLFHGHLVVSMKPIPGQLVSREVEITSAYPHAHGGPVCVGCPKASLGIDRLDVPDWGEAVDIRPDEVPVFHACGVTPQNVLMESQIPFAITHKAGHMFVTDLPADRSLW